MCRHAGNREPRALEIKTTQRKQGRKGGGLMEKKNGDRRKGGQGRGKKEDGED